MDEEEKEEDDDDDDDEEEDEEDDDDDDGGDNDAEEEKSMTVFTIWCTTRKDAPNETMRRRTSLCGRTSTLIRGGCRRTISPRRRHTRR